MRTSVILFSLALVALLWGVSFLFLLDPPLASALFALSPLFGPDGVTLDLMRRYAFFVGGFALIGAIVTAVAVAARALTRSARVKNWPLWVWVTAAYIVATLTWASLRQ